MAKTTTSSGKAAPRAGAGKQTVGDAVANVTTNRGKKKPAVKGTNAATPKSGGTRKSTMGLKKP